MGKQSPEGLANLALANQGITVRPVRRPPDPVRGDTPLVRNMVAMGAALDPPPVQTRDEIIRGFGKMPQFPSPQDTYNAIASPFRRMGEGDIAGGLGELQALGLQQYALGKAAKRFGTPGEATAKEPLIKASRGESDPGQIQTEDFIEEARRRGMSRPTVEPIMRNMVPRKQGF